MPLLLYPSSEFGNFSFVHEEFAVAPLVVGIGGAKFVGGNGGIYEEELVFDDAHIGLLERPSVIAKGFHLCAYQVNPRLIGIEDLVVVIGAPI